MEFTEARQSAALPAGVSIGDQAPTLQGRKFLPTTGATWAQISTSGEDY